MLKVLADTTRALRGIDSNSLSDDLKAHEGV